ncbi:MAG: C_GCAxxG_C_C family protein [Promethearchaeota archaeon]|nr:MAG: C_GCAxxG_C_C family protein [Candidatus Lokiarchaeota archaeon]
MEEKNYKRLFAEKIADLQKTLPRLEKGVNCAELTLKNILEVLGIKNGLLNNAIIPLAGGFGGYKSRKGWQGACGAVCGGSAAIGIILGGKKRMQNKKIPIAYLKAARFATEFEKQFGSVICAELCGYDFSTTRGFIEYQKDNCWSKTCYKYVIWAIQTVQKLMNNQLKRNW